MSVWKSQLKKLKKSTQIYPFRDNTATPSYRKTRKLLIFEPERRCRHGYCVRLSAADAIVSFGYLCFGQHLPIPCPVFNFSKDHQINKLTIAPIMFIISMMVSLQIVPSTRKLYEPDQTKA